MFVLVAACGGGSVQTVKGQFTCPSPPLAALALPACQYAHSLANRFTLRLPRHGGSVTGDGLVDGMLPPSQQDPNACRPRTQTKLTIKGEYDAGQHTVTGTLTVDNTPLMGTGCPQLVGQPAHHDRPLKLTVSGNKITGESGVLFFDATLPN